MIEDQQDINTEEVEQKSISKPKISIVSIFKDIFSFAIFFFISVGVIIYYSVPNSIPFTEEHLANSLHQSLQSAAAVYVAQQKNSPKIFSDFVVSTGPAEAPATLTLENVDCTGKSLNAKEMKITFCDGSVATYYLNNEANVSYIFEEVSEERKEEHLPLVIREPLIFTIFALIITFIIFVFFKIFFNKYILKISLYILLFSILAAIALPRYQTLYKPAIYLYPTEPTMVNVKIDEDIDLSLDIPKYPSGKGWNVLAQPDGKIVDLQLQYTDCNKLDSNRFGMEYAKDACYQNNYPYIYWEGTPKTKQLPQQTKGWLVNKVDTRVFLESKLDYIGFNKAEKDEFIRYWVHKIASYNKEMVFISFMQTTEVDAYHSMTITPTPDSINRFYIVVDLNVDRHLQPKSQKLQKFKRKGFTVVDWGGCVIDK